MAVPLPQLPPLDWPWHASARCLPSEDGDRWALDLAFGTQWDQKWMAQSVCADCPVAEECLDDSWSFRLVFGRHPDGVWGGLGKAERVRLWDALRADQGEGEAA